MITPWLGVPTSAPRDTKPALHLRIQPDVLDGIDAWIALQPDPKPTRTQAVQHALRDWLTGLWMLPFHDDPEMAN